METVQTEPTRREPRWWNESHNSRWDRVKAALRRDWEQTKADFTGGKKGQDLDQDVDDTVGQALGKRPIPPTGVPNPPALGEETRKAARNAARWEDVEDPFRYGYGAAYFYNEDWTDVLEPRLRREWSELYTDRPWGDVRESVRAGWERGRKRE